MKYYYVVFGSSVDYYLHAYSDLIQFPQGMYMPEPININNTLLSKVYKWHTSYRANKYFPIPGKSIWYKEIKNVIPKNWPICFLFFSTSIRPGILNYLKKEYPKAKFVCFYQDLIESIRKRAVSLEKIKKSFDMVISFDPADCKKYDLIYYPLVYSKPQEIDKKINIENDVYFVGLAKNRLTAILQTYTYLRESGVKCDFHIVGAEYNAQKYRDEIDYCDFVPYEVNIKNIQKAKCLLEIMQMNGTGFTLRTCEAIVYDRMLITNNSEITNAPFYNPSAIIHFDRYDDINIKNIQQGKVPYNYNYKEQLSPIKLLEFIEQKFE